MAATPHDAIPQEDREFMYELMYVGETVPFPIAIRLLRKHFLFFCDPHPWVTGKYNTMYNETWYLRLNVLVFSYNWLSENHT